MKTKTKNTVATRLLFGCCFAMAVILVPFQQLIAYLLGNDLLSVWGWVWTYLCWFVLIVVTGWGLEWYVRRKRVAEVDASAPGR